MSADRPVTEAKAKQVLSDLEALFAPWIEGADTPVLAQRDGHWAILWEGGPYEWPILATTGGRDDFGSQVVPLPDRPGVFLEPISSTWALGIYPS